MEFWGVEVPSGKPLTCDPGEDSYVHVSQVALGENKTGKGTERVVLKVKVGNKEVVIGTLSQGSCDQTTLDLIFEKEFVLSHNSSGSVYFCGYKTDAVREENGFDDEEDDESEESDEDDYEDIPIPVQLAAKENGKPGLKAAKSEVPAKAKQPAHKVEVPVVEVKPQVSKAKLALKEEKGKVGDKNDGDEEEEDDDEDEDDDMMESGSDDDDLLDSVEDDDSDEDDESEEEQPKSGKKRPLPDVKNVPGKKSKITATPGKTDPKTPSTPATTPKQQQQSGKKDFSAKKTPGKENSDKASTPASGKKLGQFFCQPCNKNFASEIALNQHKGAKHK